MSSLPKIGCKQQGVGWVGPLTLSNYPRHAQSLLLPYLEVHPRALHGHPLLDEARDVEQLRLPHPAHLFDVRDVGRRQYGLRLDEVVVAELSYDVHAAHDERPRVLVRHEFERHARPLLAHGLQPLFERELLVRDEGDLCDALTMCSYAQLQHLGKGERIVGNDVDSKDLRRQCG